MQVAIGMHHGPESFGGELALGGRNAVGGSGQRNAVTVDDCHDLGAPATARKTRLHGAARGREHRLALGHITGVPVVGQIGNALGPEIRYIPTGKTRNFDRAELSSRTMSLRSSLTTSAFR
jgi:hypothetical protein